MCDLKGERTNLSYELFFGIQNAVVSNYRFWKNIPFYEQRLHPTFLVKSILGLCWLERLARGI